MHFNGGRTEWILVQSKENYSIRCFEQTFQKLDSQYCQWPITWDEINDVQIQICRVVLRIYSRITHPLNIMQWCQVFFKQRVNFRAPKVSNLLRPSCQSLTVNFILSEREWRCFSHKITHFLCSRFMDGVFDKSEFTNRFDSDVSDQVYHIFYAACPFSFWCLLPVHWCSRRLCSDDCWPSEWTCSSEWASTLHRRDEWPESPASIHPSVHRLIVELIILWHSIL